MDANPVNIYEYEEIAKGKMGQGEYDFIAGAATDEITLRRTRAVFDAIMLRPRMMVDISQRDLGTTVLGHNIRFPILLDPAGNHAAAHPEGELASARAAGAAGTMLVLSAQSSRTLEEVAQARTRALRRRLPYEPSGFEAHPDSGRCAWRYASARPPHAASPAQIL